MESTFLYRFIENPSLLSADTLAELEQLVSRYPWFATARLLYLKNLAVLKDPRFAAELKRSAVYVSDRRQLFLLLEGERYEWDSLFGGKTATDPEDPFSLIDAFLSTCPGENERPGAPLLFQPSVSSDYLHWSLTADEGKTPADQASAPPLQHQDLIDSFLKNEEKRGLDKGKRFEEKSPGDPSESLSAPSSVEELEEAHLKPLDDSYFTETLAHIYVKQKRYEKALQIIKNLSLNYPEKNVYFADQIRFLEKLIINTKK